MQYKQRGISWRILPTHKKGLMTFQAFLRRDDRTITGVYGHIAR
tara:strand:- start:6206 stop:6337 length:132 start_codon:yes stop_codon:yes gene_type:complete